MNENYSAAFWVHSDYFATIFFIFGFTRVLGVPGIFPTSTYLLSRFYFECSTSTFLGKLLLAEKHFYGKDRTPTLSVEVNFIHKVQS